MKCFLKAVVCCMVLGVLGTCLIAGAESSKDTGFAFYPEDEILISQITEQTADGELVVITLSEKAGVSRASTKSGTKTYSGVNGSGEVQWQFMVSGTFSYNPGVSSTCTAASHSYKIVESAWSYDSGSSYKSANKAIGHGKFKHKFLGITVETRECDVVLTCDVNGKLS